MAAPRVVFVKKSQQARVHLPGRTLPIIVVPDFLCTRLTDPESDELVWNPKGTPFGSDPQGFVADMERLGNLSELEPDETHPFPHVTQNQLLPPVKHGRAMMLDVYRALFDQLSGHETTLHTHAKLKRALYFCGYDFRQDCARSALRLAEMVEEALEDTGERKVILIGHGMGGNICRYYCRGLGGESKVHQLFLMGTPLLGTPSAYVALRHGLEGPYWREVSDAIRSGDMTGTTFELIQELVELASLRSEISSAYGDLYLLLSLASGKWLSRAETRTFMRRMPAVYQMLPGAIHCKAHLHWIVFDPMETGVAPAGLMVPLPTAFRQMVEPLNWISGGTAGTQMHDALQQFLDGQAPGGPQTSRASRNAISLVELVAKTISWVARAGAFVAMLDFSHLGESLDRFSAVEKALIFEFTQELLPMFKALIAQAKRTFIDCRQPKALYEDIYTGLFDAASERPLAAASLPLFYRFDDVLTENAREEKTESLFDVLTDFLFKALPALRKLWDRGGYEVDRAESQEEQDQEARERKSRRAYVPRHTYLINAASSNPSGSTPSGCILHPLALVSNDDSNVVRARYLPNVMGDLMESAHGDGQVPKASASPAAAQLSHEVGDDARREVSGAHHVTLPGARDTAQFINDKIDEALMLKRFLRS